MSDNFFKVRRGLHINPEATPSPNEAGDIVFNSSSDKLQVRNASETDNVVTENKTASIKNKSLEDSTTYIVNTTSASKRLKVDLSGATISTTTTVVASQTANRTVTLPDATDTLVGKATTDILSNKTLALASNTITATASRAAQFNGSGNLEASTITSTELGYLSGVTSNIQTQISNHLGDTTDAHDATAISSVPSGNLAATDVQGALNELQTDIDNHVGDTSAAHAASAISNTPSGNVSATDVQAAINELQSDIDSRATASDLSNHVGDTADAHAGSAITNTPSGNLSATNVQSALNELQGDIDGHVGDTAGAHTASALTNVPYGNISATDVQAALNEVQADVDTRALNSDLTTHTGTTTSVHGSTSEATASKLVERDANGDAKFNRVLVGTAIGSGLDVVSAGNLNIGTTATNINIGAGASTTSVGGSFQSSGTTTNLASTETLIKDKLITLNNSGAAASGDGAGIEIEEDNVATGYIKTSSDRNGWEFKAPNSSYSASLRTPSFSDEIVLSSATQSLRNKTFLDAVTLSEVSTPSTPSSGYGKVYFKSDGFLYQINDAGTESKVGAGGGGGINYIDDNPDAESATTGWVAYDDGDDGGSTNPVNGTGGAAVGTTITRTSTNPLRGTNSFVMTPAADAGEGVSYDFTIDRADLAKVLKISFDFETDTLTTEDYFSVWIYDKDATTLIQPVPYKLPAVTANTPHKFESEFQTSATSTNYRLIIHQAVTTTIVVKFDNVFVGPDSKTLGVPVTDWVSYTPTVTGLGTISNEGFYWKRVGDSISIKGTLVAGTVAGTTLSISLPTGVSIDSSKNPSSTNTASHGYLYNTTSVGGFYPSNSTGPFVVFSDTAASSTLLYVSEGNSGARFAKANGDAILGNTERLRIEADNIPVVGWSSSTVLSSDSDTRVIDFGARLITAGQTLGTSAEEVIFNTTRFDTHGAYNTSTGRFTAPISGKYHFDSNLLITMGGTAATNMSVYFLKNGTGGQLGTWYSDAFTNSKSYTIKIAADIDLNAGDYVSVWVSTTGQTVTASFNANNDDSAFYGHRVSGPAQIAASESVNVIYQGSTGTTVGTSVGNIIYNTKVKDSHSAYNATTGVFTAPISGIYSFSIADFVMTQSSVVNTGLVIYLYKGATQFGRMAQFQFPITGADLASVMTGVMEMPMLAGELASIQIARDSSVTSFSLDTTATLHTLSISRTGNY